MKLLQNRVLCRALRSCVNRRMSLHSSASRMLAWKSDCYVALQKNLAKDVDGLLATLPAREAGVLRARYGLDSGLPATLEDIGHKFSVSSH